MQEEKLKDESNNANVLLCAVSFVNITNGDFYDFKSWDEIVTLGGLKKILPVRDYNNIYNENACKETINQVMGDILLAKITRDNTVRICNKNSIVTIDSAIEYLKPFKKAILLFHKRNSTLKKTN